MTYTRLVHSRLKILCRDLINRNPRWLQSLQSAQNQFHFDQLRLKAQQVLAKTYPITFTVRALNQNQSGNFDHLLHLTEESKHGRLTDRHHSPVNHCLNLIFKIQGRWFYDNHFDISWVHLHNDATSLQTESPSTNKSLNDWKNSLNLCSKTLDLWQL